MEIYSTILFELQVQHQYFKDGLAHNLTIEPTNTARQVMSQYQWLFKPTDEGMAVVSLMDKDNNGNLVPRVPVQTDASMTFAITTIEPQYINFTDLNFATGAINYWNNLGHQELMPIQQRNFQYQLGNAPVGITGFTVKKINGIEVINQQFYEGYRTTYCQIDLTHEPEGAYILHITTSNGAITETFFSSDLLSWRPPFAVYEWLYPQANSQSTTSIYGQQYQLQFNTRETLWRYYCIPNKGTQYQNLTISSIQVNEQAVDFDLADEMATLPDGNQAYAFTSTAAIPLQEQPDWPISLSAQNLPGDMALPYAQPVLIHPGDASDKDKIYSNIYVMI